MPHASMLATRLDSVKPSPSMAARSLVEGLRAAGRTIIDFTIGEPDFPTPPHVVAAGAQALASGQTRYTASAGIALLRQAIAAKLGREKFATAIEQIEAGCAALARAVGALTFSHLTKEPSHA